MNQGPLIIPALPCHIKAIADNVRNEDREELWRATCQCPGEVITKSYIESTKAWTGIYDTTPVCMFGVVEGTKLSGIGIPWMVGTYHLDNIATVFLRRSRVVVNEMLNIYTYLSNYVDSRNTRAILWLKWLGFSMGEAEPYGPFNMPFIRFEMKR